MSEEYTVCDVCEADAAPEDHLCSAHRVAVDAIGSTIQDGIASLRTRFKREHLGSGWQRITIDQVMPMHFDEYEHVGSLAQQHTLKYVFATATGALAVAGHPELSKLVYEVGNDILAMFELIDE